MKTKKTEEKTMTVCLVFRDSYGVEREFFDVFVNKATAKKAVQVYEKEKYGEKRPKGIWKWFYDVCEVRTR